MTLVAELDSWVDENQIKIQSRFTVYELKAFMNAMDTVQNGIEEIDRLNDFEFENTINRHRDE